MKKYRKVPVVIEAVKWTGDNFYEIMTWADKNKSLSDIGRDKDTLAIRTPEGIMTASLGDYIIKGVKGEFYPCKPDIFEATYEQVDA